MALPRYSKQNIFQRAINQVGKLNGLVEVIMDADGKMKFKSSFDGKEFETIPQAIGHIESTGINTYRVFGPTTQVGSKKGLDQIAEEALALSNKLKFSTIGLSQEQRAEQRVQKQVLNRLGLGDLIGKDIEITYQKFNYEGKAQKLAQIVQSDFVRSAGIVNIGDEGVTALNYRVGKRVLSSQQAKDLKYVLGLGTLTDSFVDKVFGSGGTPDFGGFSKLPKRIQGMLAERGVSLTGDDITSLLQNQTYKFDDVSSFFRGMLGGRTTQSERFLLTAGLGLDEEAIKQATLTKGGTFDFVGGLEKKFMELSGIQEAEMNKVRNIWSQAETLYKSYSKEDKKKKGVFGAFKDVVKDITSSGTDEEKVLSLKIQGAFDGIERMRDGEFLGNVNLVDTFIKNLQAEKEAIVNSSAQLSPENLKKISEIDSQLDSLLYMKEAGQEGLDSSVARLQFPGMQGKGELYLRRFSWLPKELRDKMLIMPQSALKKEVQGIPSILLDVSKRHAENVYADPLMLLYHQDYFGSPEFLKGAVNNVEKQRQAIQSFMETGALPEDVRKNIFGAIDSQLKENIDIFPKLDAAARASYIKNRSEAKAIQDMMAAGVDPRQIPALVRRITDYYTQNAYRMKNQRIDLAMPDTSRLALRTYESSAESGFGSSLYQSTKIDLRGLGSEGAAYARAIGSTAEDINFVQFRIQGNRMMLNGSAAHLYHHSLGTFDLDDKGVPMMTTFKDANGNDRLAFMTMRQPTGFQEKIFMQGDLTDTSTLKAILQKSSGDFAGLLNDADAVASLSDPKEQRILIEMRKAATEKGNLDLRGLSSEDIEKVIVKLRTGFGDKYGFQELIKMSKGDLLGMAMTKSASPLGMDKMINSGAYSGGTLQDFRAFLAESGVKADAMPDYTQGNYISLITKEESSLQEDAIVKRFNKRQGSSFGSLEEINLYLQGLDKGSVEYSEAFTRLATVEQTVGETLQKRSAIAVDDSLGLYINRQAAAISMYQQVDDVLEGLATKGVGIGTDAIADYFRANFSTALIPPSPAVDVSKSLVAKMVLDEDAMRKAAIAADQLRGTTGVSEAAVEKVISDLLGRSVKLGEMGDIAVQQTGKGVGFLRAAQIAQGTFTADELIGFDAALFGEGPYARLRKKDMLKTIESVVQGANDYLSKITDADQRGRVQAFIDEISSGSVEEALAKVTIESGSRYAVVGKYADAASQAKDMIDTTSSYARRMSRTGSDPFEAVMQAEYMNRAEALVESQQDNLNKIVALGRADDTDITAQVVGKYYSEVTGGDLYRGLSAMVEADSSTNILDAFDTLEATIRTQYDQRTADKILNTRIDIQGQEDALIKIREDARARRVNNKILRRVTDEAYGEIEGIATREGFAGIKTSDITQEQAEDFIRKRRIMMADSGLSLQELGESQDFYDFMRLRSAEPLAGEELSQQALDVFHGIRAQEELAVINGRTASSYTVRGSDIGDDARRIITEATDDDTVTSVARGSYTRIQDFIKNGSLKELFDDKLIKRSTFAIAGLAAFGFIYSARKERTQEEASGPPLLPGGSAYETDFPRNLPSISDLKYLNPTTLGMQYKINVSGSQQDIEKMQYLASGVVEGNIDSTIYSSLPRLGRDPYSQVASRY